MPTADHAVLAENLQRIWTDSDLVPCIQLVNGKLKHSARIFSTVC